MLEFNNWFPASLYGDNALNVMSFGAYGDGVAHTMNDLGYANLTAARVDYPQAIDMNDTADWCAITECAKHAFKHENPPGSGTWVPNPADGRASKPMFFPGGRYITHKPVLFRDVTNATIYGKGYVQIYNENTTPPDNVGVIFDGLQASRIDNIDMQSAGGAGAQGCRIDAFGGAYINTTGNIFYNCNFAAVGGVACHIGQSQMSSEQTFIKCSANHSEYGFIIDNWNALNYQFLACGGVTNTKQWLRVNTGGMCVVQNASLADNGTEDLYEGFDIWNGAGSIVIIGSRSESMRFASGMNITMIGCLHATAGAQAVFCGGGPLNMINCQSTMSRICGDGPIKIDESSAFSFSSFYVTNIANGTGGKILITHSEIGGAPGRAVFYDGDEVEVEQVASTGGGAAATNGLWIISKIDNTHCELIGSTFVADTYDYVNARIKGGPRWHLREVIYPFGSVNPSRAVVTPTGSRHSWDTKKRDFNLVLADSGWTFDNAGATGPVVFTLPFTQKPSWVNVRGARFYFTVMAAQTLTIRVHTDTLTSPSTRIFRAGGFATAGLTVSSNVVGNTIELILADGPANLTNDVALLAYRWLIRSETGTWTIAGTPS